MSTTEAQVNVQGGGLQMPIKGVFEGINLGQNNYTMIFDTTTGVIVANLPAAVSNPGRIYIMKNAGGAGHNVTITANGTDSVDGAGTLALTDGNVIMIQCDGIDNWHTLLAG